MLVQVTAPHFVAGLVMENDIVIEAAPILRWAIGKKRDWLRSYFERKDWTVKVVPSQPFQGCSATLLEGRGHPWDGTAGWDHLEVTATTEAELTAFIEDAKTKFWKVWIRDNTGQKTALLFRPQGAKSP